jgi:hypothetical protein
MTLLLHVTCHKSTLLLCRFLTRRGLPRTLAKRNILLKDVNRAKRIEFAKRMLQKSDEVLKLIMFTDETMVKAYPNGEVVYYRAFQEQHDIVSPRLLARCYGVASHLMPMDSYTQMMAI